MSEPAGEHTVDVVVVGAGFAGLYLTYRLTRLGMRVLTLEQGDDVGGTWYWNRYPGARCDAESLAYSFSFSEEMEQEWQWSERYATQPEILRYARHVADRFELRQHIRFEQTVNAVHWQGDHWQVATTAGLNLTARFCFLATGCLSVPQLPDIPGLDRFAGERYQASLWPHAGVDFSNKRVGQIGTGSSGIQAAPVIAAQAASLTVFQRTPNFSVPAENGVLDEHWVSQFKQHYREHRQQHRLGLSSGFGDLEIKPVPRTPAAATAVGLSDQQVADILDPFWARGGAFFMGAFEDTLINPESNQRVADYVRAKIRATVRDPVTAAALCPQDHPIGSKRICVDTGYYETFNRDNVALVDVAADPIQTITETGLQTRSGTVYEFDALVLATGFDAMTGALLRMDVQGRDGVRLQDQWQAGPSSYLGLAMADFPNLFMITGPGSPSVLSNMLVSIEQHVDWTVALLEHMRARELQQVEASAEAQAAWTAHVDDIAQSTLFPRGGSWYLGANVAGQERVFMPYAAGVGAYREHCDEVADDNYRGFEFT